ncbi:MAG: P-loop NTPase fold protein, partial [Gammaproteobacteria bacterium]
SCYASADNFLEDVEKHLDLELSIETETALLNEVEHLHPEPPVQISSALVKWLTGLAALLGILTVKGMTLMGVAQTKLLKGLLNTSGILLQPAEPVGSRLLFERHFRLITQLLGKRRVVLFIDDLDRCDFEYTRKVLEITNFLASAGDLFMVLGMAPRYVLANVTLSFQDMAKAVHEGDVLNSEKSDALTGKEAGQSWFARHYLQKLIHIEVPVPKAKSAQVLAMLKAEQGEMDKTELLEKQLDSLLAMSGKVLRSFLLLTALGGGIYWGYSLSRPLQTVSGPPETMHKITLSVTSGSGEQAEPKYPPEQRAEPDIEPSSEVFRPGYSSENIENWPAWTLVFIVFVLVFCSFGWIYLIRNAQLIKEKSWLVWLEPVLQRLKVKLLGPELREDSVSFSDALEIWHKLIAITDPSPRNLKAFLNRLRYFASRYPGAADSRREAQLVALATMHYAFDEDMDEALALMRAYETNTLDSKFVTSKLKNDNHWLELKSALKAHWEKFAAFPNKEDREFFKYLCEDIRIHRRD